jgi:long-chain acyl-CoA synthetase
VVLRAPAEPAELLAFLRGHLAAYKLPRQITALPELPRTASGKLQRARLRELLG